MPFSLVFMSEFNFLEGEVLLVDKPLGWTSFDVVNKLRYTIKRKLGVKKIKVGHAGTLDPLASGLLIICTGKKTKDIEHLMLKEKSYVGSLLLNQTRISLDFETAIDNTFDCSGISQEDLEQRATRFLGKQLQLPPSFSAKRIDGKKSYELARAGKEVLLKKQEIEIFEFELLGIKIPQIDFKLKCSKGTYVRSLARDFGASFGIGGVLSSLRRTSIGEYKIEQAFSLDSLLLRVEDS